MNRDNRIPTIDDFNRLEEGRRSRRSRLGGKRFSLPGAPVVGEGRLDAIALSRITDVYAPLDLNDGDAHGPPF